MKKLNILLALILCLIGTFKTSNFTFASLEAMPVSQTSAILLYNPSLICANNTDIFVYDSYSSSIKVYNKTTKSLRAANSNLNKENVTNLSVIDNLLFVSSDKTINVYNTENLEMIANVTSVLSTISKFCVYKTSATNICLVLNYYNKDTNTNSLEIKKLVLNDSVWAFASTSSTIDASRGFNLSTAISNMIITPSAAADTVYLVYSSEDSLYSMPFRPNYETEISYTITKHDEIVRNSTILGVTKVNYNSIEYLVVINAAGFNLYTQTLAPNYLLASAKNYSANLNQISSYCSFDNSIFIASSTENKIDSYTLSQTDTLTLSKTAFIYNSDLTIENLDSADFEYYVAKVDTNLYITPFTTTPTSTINSNEMVCKIANVKVGSLDFEDFVYCLFTSETNNYYGYVKATSLTKITQNTFQATSLKVYANTNLYTLPTRITDEKNTVLETFNNITTLTVLSSCVNKQYSVNGTQFVMVKTADNKVGFIEFARTLISSGTREFITNNATIETETKVYLENSTDSEIIDILNKDERVKIDENQPTNAKMLKVYYNNENGDEITGYILADNVARDSWTVLQIIGLVLVGLNAIFIVALIYVKKRINHD